jgi:hypothetical protein
VRIWFWGASQYLAGMASATVVSWHLASVGYVCQEGKFLLRLDQQSTHTTHSPTISTPYSTDGVPCTVWTLHLQCLRIWLFSFPRALRCHFVGRSSVSHAFGYGRFGYAFDKLPGKAFPWCCCVTSYRSNYGGFPEFLLQDRAIGQLTLRQYKL